MKLTLQDHPISKILGIQETITSRDVEVLRVGILDLVKKTVMPIIVDLKKAKVTEKETLKKLLQLKSSSKEQRNSIFFLCTHPTLSDANSLEDLLREIKHFQSLKVKLKDLQARKAKLKDKLTEIHDKANIAEDLQEKNQTIRNKVQQIESDIKNFLGEI